MTSLVILLTCLVGIPYFLSVVNCDTTLERKTPVRNTRNTSSCDMCDLLVNSFNKGMTRTARERFGGGDTAWEEKNLGSYATSETRLVEIQEQLCDEDKKTGGLCHTLAEIWEHHLENWWLRDRKAFPDLKQYLCEVVLKVCKPTTETTQRCPTGFTRVEDKGCLDVNECLTNPCKRDEFCTNNEGSFSCTDCDSACNGCFGSGPNKCKMFKRIREKRSIADMLDDGKLLNFNSLDIHVLLITALLILVPSIFCVLFPILFH